MGSRLYFRMLIATLLALVSTPLWAAQNELTWDATADPRAQRTQIERCTDVDCNDPGAAWAQIGEVDASIIDFTDPDVVENGAYSYRAFFWNQDYGRGGASNVASKRVPFGGPPTDIPANIGVY